MLHVSPLAPDSFPSMPALAGVRMGAVSCGIRYEGRTDLVLIECRPAAAVAGVFTRSLTAAAPVDWCRAILPHGLARAILINSGNANAFTGAAGEAAARRTAARVAALLRCSENEVYLASTGVIGEDLPDGRITGALGDLRRGLSGDAWEAAAAGIMTTDTFAKGASRGAVIDGRRVTIGGIAKGSGMIAPDMATMLAFVFTDAALPVAVLQPLLRAANQRSFNSITVDGDTSTSDSVLLCATGQGPVLAGDHRDPRLRGFRAQLEAVLVDLAQQIVRDGEGASKFVTIRVRGAASARAARRIGLTVGNSPLVKTAIAGADANWGRIVMAVGKAGEKADRDRLAIRVGGVTVAAQGRAHPDYVEGPTAEYMKGSEIDIDIDVGVGRGRATVWTCDLTHGYIDINADYRS